MNKIVDIIKNIITILFTKSVTRNAAALSYYLTLSVFPFLICLAAILSSLNIQDTVVFELLDGVIPDATYISLSGYLEYIGTIRTEVILFIGITAMLTSSSAAFRTFTGYMGEVQGERRFTGILRYVFSFLYSILFLIAIYGSAVIVFSGEWLMGVIDTHFRVHAVTELWLGLRFIAMFLLLFAVIYSVYWFSAPKDAKQQPRLLGALTASILLVATSIVYSHLISASMRFEILYGSLAAFIILLVWLYTCSIIIIMGNVLNISVGKSRIAEQESDVPAPCQEGDKVPEQLPESENI